MYLEFWNVPSEKITTARFTWQIVQTAQIEIFQFLMK